MQKVYYEIENREEALMQIEAAGKMVVEDVTIDIVGERLSNCYFVVDDAPAEPTPPGGDTEEMADMRAALETLGVAPEEGGM